MKYILGQKLGMSQLFENGKSTPVTLISVGPCYVLQKKNKEKDGYQALQVGFQKIEKKSKIGKSMKGKEYRYIKEYKTEEGAAQLNVGDEINASIFQEGEIVKVSGKSKGKGFQGGVKRHGFHGRNQTHGVKHEHRTIGSTGTRFPQHVMKGRRMPGRMGFDNVTVKGLEIMKVDKENNLLVIKGAVPGNRRTLLEIKG